MNTLLSATGVLATMEPRLFDLDFQLFHDAALMIIAVVALFLIMSYFLFNPAREFLKKRQEKIRTELEDAKNNQEDAKALKAEYESKLKNIDKEAESILADARKRALANENRIVAAAKETGKVVTVEEHSVIGGLGSAVCDCLSEKAPTAVLKIGVNDVFGESGPAAQLIKKYGLDADTIAAKVEAFVK